MTYGKVRLRASFLWSAENVSGMCGQGLALCLRLFRRIPSARTMALLMTIGRDRLSKAETVTIAAVGADVVAVVEAREISGEFQMMIRRKAGAGRRNGLSLPVQISLPPSPKGRKDREAARAAIALPWPNDETEGLITRLKLAKRQMYGRGKIDLLQARLSAE